MAVGSAKKANELLSNKLSLLARDELFLQSNFTFNQKIVVSFFKDISLDRFDLGQSRESRVAAPQQTLLHHTCEKIFQKLQKIG